MHVRLLKAILAVHPALKISSTKSAERYHPAITGQHVPEDGPADSAWGELRPSCMDVTVWRTLDTSMSKTTVERQMKHSDRTLTLTFVR